ncbi:glycosyltransferase [Pelagibacterales bacterium SAG-MED05]|nr:glycosyltransferase [Pelagibacterales bacterium SAG-MED05]
MKKKLPLVSIIMNCHNGEKYLINSLNSIFAQDYHNWELIFWDNKSDDNSKKIIKKYQDKRIRYFYSKRLFPLYHARNKAIKKTRGNFICFLDTDDYWNKNFLSKFIAKFNKENSDVVFSKYYIYNQKTKKKKVNEKKNFFKSISTQQLLDKYIVGISAIMLKKHIFKKYRFNNKFQIIGDFDLFIKLSHFHKFYMINEPLLTYRTHENNFSKKNLKLYLNEYNYWLRRNKLTFIKNFQTRRLKFFIFKLKLKLILKNLIF